MLTLAEIPAHMADWHRQSQSLAQGLLELQPPGETIHCLEREADLELHFRDCYIHIRKGVFRRLLEGKTVRFHEPGDWIAMSTSSCPQSSLASEFGSEVSVFTGNDFRAFLANTPKAMELWLQYSVLEQRLLLGISSLFMPDETRRDIQLLDFKPGDTIIKEGEASRFIFELVQGSAAVFSGGVHLSTIMEGEIFGEISYFAGTERTATVTAQTDCLVQAMERENFASAIRRRPETVLRLIRILCDRLLSVDRRLIEGGV